MLIIGLLNMGEDNLITQMMKVMTIKSQCQVYFNKFEWIILNKGFKQKKQGAVIHPASSAASQFFNEWVAS